MIHWISFRNPEKLSLGFLRCFSLTGYPAFFKKARQAPKYAKCVPTQLKDQQLRTMRGFYVPMFLPQMIFFERKKRLKYNIW